MVVSTARLTGRSVSTASITRFIMAAIFSASASSHSTKMESWICSSCLRAGYRGQLFVDGDHGDFHQVCFGALDGHVHGGTLGGAAHDEVGAVDVGHGAAAAEQRLDIALFAGHVP